MAGPHDFASIGESVVVDLGALFAGFGGGTAYAASDASGVTVDISQLSATPTPSDCGWASVKLTATDSVGTMTRTFSLFVDGC